MTILDKEELHAGHYMNYQRKMLEMEVKIYDLISNSADEIVTKGKDKFQESFAQSNEQLDSLTEMMGSTQINYTPRDIQFSDGVDPNEKVIEEIFTSILSEDEKDIARNLGYLEDAPIDYQFKGPQDELRRQNEQLFNKLRDVKPLAPQQKSAKRIGISAVSASDRFHHKGQLKEAKLSQEIAKGMLDISLGLVPGVSIAKDAYEAITGKNLVTGEEIGAAGRALAIVGIVTLGGFNYFKAAGKGVFTVLNVLKKMDSKTLAMGSRFFKRGFNAASKAAGNFIDSTIKWGLKKADEVKDMGHFFKDIVQSNAGSSLLHTPIVEVFDKVARGTTKWDNVNALVHTVRGTSKIASDGTYKLVKGLHTKMGLDHFVKMNKKAGKALDISSTSSFSRLNNSESILKQTLSNGVTRVQLPRNTFKNRRAFENAIAATNDGRILGAKTLFPENFSVNKIAEATEAIIRQNANSLNGRLEGIYEGVKIVIRRNPETGKVLTCYPSWIQ